MSTSFMNSGNSTEIKSATTAAERRKKPIRSCMESALELYFINLEGQKPSNLYQMVLGEVEVPLLKSVMHYTRGNQSKAAEILGINRNTLRKKLKQYHLDS